MRRMETASTPSSSAMRSAASTIASVVRPAPRAVRAPWRRARSARRSRRRSRRRSSDSLDTRTVYGTVRRTMKRTPYETNFPAIRAEGLTKRFGATEALAGIDLEVAPGEARGLLGHNGAGKTTAVRILATLLAPDAGRALVGGPGAVREQIAFAGQQATLDERLTGRENLMLLARLQRLSTRAARRRTADLLERFELTAAADRLVQTYSGGMRRRLDLA